MIVSTWRRQHLRNIRHERRMRKCTLLRIPRRFVRLETDEASNEVRRFPCTEPGIWGSHCKAPLWQASFGCDPLDVRWQRRSKASFSTASPTAESTLKTDQNHLISKRSVVLIKLNILVNPLIDWLITSQDWSIPELAGTILQISSLLQIINRHGL